MQQDSRSIEDSRSHPSTESPAEASSFNNEKASRNLSAYRVTRRSWELDDCRGTSRFDNVDAKVAAIKAEIKDTQDARSTTVKLGSNSKMYLDRDLMNYLVDEASDR